MKMNLLKFMKWVQVLLKIGFILGGSEEEAWIPVVLGKPGGFCLKTSKNYLIGRALWSWKMSPYELVCLFSVPGGWKEKLRDLVKINESCGVRNWMLPWSLSDCDDLGVYEVTVLPEPLLTGGEYVSRICQHWSILIYFLSAWALYGAEQDLGI